jgi:7-cyano-7-deazaguanine reductase
MSVHDSALGQDTVYPTVYDPSLLFPIARDEGRAHLGVDAPAAISAGVDVWHLFELSWLDGSGKPVVAVGRYTLPADSPNLIESKSFKLYLNSLNFATFAAPQDFIDTAVRDLSAAAGTRVAFELLSVDELVTAMPQGLCLDDLPLSEPAPTSPDAQLLKLDPRADATDIIEETLYCNLLRSNCPVTGQPDWGTIFIRYRGAKVCQNGLLTYIISYRTHSGFHEQCVEQIFADFWRHLNPEALAIHAQYTRRGGLDINPCRSSTADWLPKVTRLARQ